MIQTGAQGSNNFFPHYQVLDDAARARLPYGTPALTKAAMAERHLADWQCNQRTQTQTQTHTQTDTHTQRERERETDRERERE